MSDFTYQNLPPLLRAALSEKEVYSASGAKLLLDSNVSCDEALTLYAAVREIRPAVSVEVGLAKGVSTLAILQALRDNANGSHHVIDPFQKNYDYAGVEMVKRADLAAYFTFYEKFAEEVIPTLPPLQFAFIDASHLYDLTLTEFVLVDKKLTVGGLIGLHDMWMPSQQKLLRYILSNRAYKLYHNFGVQQHSKQPKFSKRAIKQRFIKGLRRFPYANRIFSPELLAPWSTLSLPNLVLLQKTAPDVRPWNFHNIF